MKNILVLGGGFAGLWAALGAARRLDELGVAPDEAGVTLVNRDAWHCIRVRNYEPDITDARVALSEALEPAGVELVVGEATAIDLTAHTITAGDVASPWDRLILAAGSRLHRPEIPGLAEYGFSIDTWSDAKALGDHLDALSARPDTQGRDTVLIVGGGLTGVELACEMPDRLRASGLADGRVILADRNRHIGSDMGDDAAPVIAEALSALGVETRTGVTIAAVDAGGVTLGDGSHVAAATVVWTAGMRASALAGLLPIARDRLGRVPVDQFMRVAGLDGVFAAGDIATAPLGAGHATVMSCQHARPMGRYAGLNAASDLLGHDMRAMEIGYYVTCLDLGPWGALYTEGWDRRVTASGPAVKKTKMTINRERIYPPRSGDRRDLFAAASPEIQMAPARGK